jgi:hypothetical protein
VQAADKKRVDNRWGIMLSGLFNKKRLGVINWAALLKNEERR